MSEFATYYCGTIAKDDALECQEILRQHGGIPKATKKPRGFLLIAYFPDGLTHEKRCGIQAELGNAGIFAC